LLLKVHTENGLVGLGEASLGGMGPDRSGEMPFTSFEVLQQRVAPKLLGKDAMKMGDILDSLYKLGTEKYVFPYTRAAVDIALHDLVGKAKKLPVYKLLNPLVEAPPAPFKVGRSLGVKPAPELVTEAKRLLETHGYHGFTCKGCDDVDGDIERFIALREALGPDFPLEIDPNQAYSVKDAVRVVKALEPHGLSCIEQPVAWFDLQGMAEVQAASSVTLAADEALMIPEDVNRIAKMKAAKWVTIKVAKLGGLREASRIYRQALDLGLGCNLGSKHPFGVGTAAVAHFCAAHPMVEQPLGYGAPLERFVDDILEAPGIHFEKSLLHVPQGPGLGVTVDQSKLEKYAIADPAILGKVPGF